MKIHHIAIMALVLVSTSCTKKQVEDKGAKELIVTNLNAKGKEIKMEVVKGRSFNHPLIAIWLEDAKGNYKGEVYVAQSIATGVFMHGNYSQGKWIKGERRRPAALPYWTHRRGVKSDDGLFLPSPENPVQDAVTGATPKANFEIKSKMDVQPGDKIFLEVNQTWDWNNFWHNNKYPDNEEYKTSCQPSLIYSAEIKSLDTKKYELKVIGHGHYAGENGDLFPDVSNHTTALDILRSIHLLLEE